ncbi:hypothetical protein DEO72_LG6g1450 [Vigna unguiculata]|uniref:Uncharacterized protein n=1 Tax=Vigna unguiculata TaxID=3917 RepID=A0A4D6M8M4_VIGUN|nr:hypothetical protein DEO72_LG6g1450 [Vigna unguiculata]
MALERHRKTVAAEEGIRMVENFMPRRRSVVRHKQWKELRVEDSVRVQEKTQGRFGVVKTSRIRVKSEKSRDEYPPGGASVFALAVDLRSWGYWNGRTRVEILGFMVGTDLRTVQQPGYFPGFWYAAWRRLAYRKVMTGAMACKSVSYTHLSQREHETYERELGA